MTSTEVTEKFEIRNRHTNAVQVTAEITCKPDASISFKLGLAIKWAAKSEANLSGAYLSRADLSGAYLSGADLSRADLSESALRPFKADLFLTLSSLRAGALEAVHLVQKLRAGKVDGSTYGDHGGNRCACLVGTIAAARGLAGAELDNDSGRPAERWFMMIGVGDKAGAIGEDGKETGGGYAARMALEWTLDWCVSMGIDPDAPPAPISPEVEAA